MTATPQRVDGMRLDHVTVTGPGHDISRDPTWKPLSPRCTHTREIHGGTPTGRLGLWNGLLETVRIVIYWRVRFRKTNFLAAHYLQSNKAQTLIQSQSTRKWKNIKNTHFGTKTHHFHFVNLSNKVKNDTKN